MKGFCCGSVAAPRRFSSTLCFFFFFLHLCCFLGVLRCEDQPEPTLPESEIEALQQIASKLGINFWDFKQNPCKGEPPWLVHPPNPQPVSNVTCGSCDLVTNRTTNVTTNICHVISIQLKSQNLTGVLPSEFAKLPKLQIIDLTRNYINGTIPVAWASLPLLNISLIGNRISGRIPDEIGNINTLTSMTFEDNLLEGPVPASLGELRNLNRLFLSGNNLTGELPDTLGNLKNLEDFRIDGTGISGRLPSFIGNWTKLKRLNMQGTSLEGPFPSTFSILKDLVELRISDFKGAGNFPPLSGTTNLEILSLRNCLISGKIPNYIASMTKLQYLDLSFNNFIGEIPNVPRNVEYMILTNNKLNGSIPEWVFKRTVDLSYNYFTGPQYNSDIWQKDTVNLVSSFSLSTDNVITWFLRKKLPCPKRAKYFNLFINCGGYKIHFNGTDYEEDLEDQGPAIFWISPSKKWAYSSTGRFLSNGAIKNINNYRVTNMSALKITDPELYMSARINPLSLKYYGLCLQKGNYTVKLHFAEIVFTDDQTYFSVGRRFFDVSIQGQKVQRDFNIAKEANGTGRAIVLSFNASVEDDGTLEIHFQWAGKGTVSIPEKAVYGPLISAISVTPNFKPWLDEEDKKLPTGGIIGITIASCTAVILILLLLWFVLWKKDQENEELKGLQFQTGYFSLREIKAATRNFDPANKIGQGGFGSVYKGILPNGALIAVKQLSSKSKQGNREFLNEIGMITALQHPNLVKLYGCCIEGNQLLLIYEYMENNCLARALFGPEEMKMTLNWQTRFKISLGIARALAYLHEESRLKIVHRDIKATNVLLDKGLNAKISDFGLAKLDDDEEHSHVITRIVGTVGYMAPEYATRGQLSDKADVYSFGILILEIVCGQSNTSCRLMEDNAYLLDWAFVLQKQGRLLELVDPQLGSDYSTAQAEQLLNLALVCASASPALRPTMTEVVMLLESGTPTQALLQIPDRTVSKEAGSKTFEKLSYDSCQGISVDKPLFNSSMVASSISDELISNSAATRLLEDRSW